MRQGFDVSINDYNRELFTSFRTVVEMKEGESAVHVLLKVVAAAVFHDPALAIEPVGVDPQFRPDLLLLNIDGSPKLWIECGQVKTQKLDKIVSRYGEAEFAVVKRTRREAQELCERGEKEIRRPWKIEYLGFDPNFTDGAATHVLGRNDCIAILSGDELQWLINGNDFTSKIHRYRSDPPGYRGKNYE